jgi:hypothetical protein
MFNGCVSVPLLSLCPHWAKKSVRPAISLRQWSVTEGCPIINQENVIGIGVGCLSRHFHWIHFNLYMHIMAGAKDIGMEAEEEEESQWGVEEEVEMDLHAK